MHRGDLEPGTLRQSSKLGYPPLLAAEVDEHPQVHLGAQRLAVAPTPAASASSDEVCSPRVMWSAMRRVATTRIAIGVARSAIAHNPMSRMFLFSRSPHTQRE